MVTRTEKGYVLVGIGIGAIIVLSLIFLRQILYGQSFSDFLSIYLTGIVDIILILYGLSLIKKK